MTPATRLFFPGLLLSLIPLCLVSALLIFAIDDFVHHLTPPKSFDGGAYYDLPISNADMAFLISSVALLFTCLGTTSSIILGWRADRRQAEEQRLKIVHLELQLEEARMRAKANPTNEAAQLRRHI